MMMRSLAMFVGCFLFVVLPSAQEESISSQVGAAKQGGIQEGDWPLFRGDPLQTGVARTALPDKLEVRWKVALKKGIESTAAIVKDTVYVGCYDEHLHAFDLKTGMPKWKTKLGAIKAPPSVYEGNVFVGDEDGMFYCVEAATGKKLWEFETNGEITGGANFAGDKVIFGSHDANLYCLAIKNGKQVWKVKTEGPVYGSAAVANGETFVAGCDAHLHIIDVAQGNELAKVELTGQTLTTAAIVGDKLYVGNNNSDLQGIDLKKKNILWTYTPKRAQPFYASAAVTDRLVVAGSRDRKVHAVDRVKGGKIWSFEADERVDSSPVIVGSRVYFGSAGGTFYVVDLARGKEVQSLPLGDRITASPAVASGCLVIGTTDGLLYCLGKKD